MAGLVARESAFLADVHQRDLEPHNPHTGTYATKTGTCRAKLRVHPLKGSLSVTGV